MTKEEKGIREEIGSLRDKMKGITQTAKDEDRSLTEDEREEHASLYDQIQEKKKDLEVLERQNEIDEEVAAKAKPVNDETDVSVKGNKAESEEAMYHNTAKIFLALANPQLRQSEKDKEIEHAQKELFKGGHYKGFKNSVEAFSTLTDSDGGIFLPTEISEQIMEIERQYGAFPANSMRIPMSVGGGRQILPNLLGEITFYAVNQGSEAKASRFTFSGLALEELKWMAFVPWTNEMGSAAGERLVQLVMRKLGEASARVKDDAAINADGTSTYHNLKGLLNRSNDSDHPEVRRSTAASGNTSFGAVDDEDFLNATLDVAPSIRDRGIYVMHPDWDVRLRQIKDNDGQPIYRTTGEISRDGGNWFIGGKRVVFSEKAPNEDGTSAAYALFYVPDYFAFGDVGAFSTQELTEATIKDENDSDIRLGSQDMRALRIKEFFDFELSQLTISSGGNDLGAFTVLETAAT